MRKNYLTVFVLLLLTWSTIATASKGLLVKNNSLAAALLECTGDHMDLSMIWDNCMSNRQFCLLQMQIVRECM